MAGGKRIRVLKAGLSYGNHIYQAGDELKAAHFSPSAHDYASGKKLFQGRERIMEYVADDEEPAAPVVEDAESDQDSEADAKMESEILKLVSEGLAKGAIVKQLAEGQPYSQRHVGEVFDGLVETGRVVEGDKRGEYQVKEG